MAVLGVIVTIAKPSFQSYIDKTDNALAVSQILPLQSVIERYYLLNNRYPAKLDDIAGSLPDNGLDPWGNKYIYLNIADDWPRTRGPSRKDRNINPINT